MKSADGSEMSGTPAPVPGSAEGTENRDDQSRIPPAAHTPSSAEGEDDESAEPSPSQPQSS